MRELREILIVDDNGTLVNLLKRVLGKHFGSAKISTATSVQAALRILINRPIDVLLLDVTLPDGSGADLAERARRLTPAPLIVVMSGEASRKELADTLVQGVAGYLEKPIDIKELIATIERVWAEGPPLTQALKAHVGRTPLKSIVRLARHVMSKEAMALAEGNVTHAANMLDLTRQAVQNMTRTPEPDDDKPDRSEPVGDASISDDHQQQVRHDNHSGAGPQRPTDAGSKGSPRRSRMPPR